MEATMVCLDNSEWTRNGDFLPTRFEAQTDAANLICGAKMQMHPESGAGILSMAGDRVEVGVTPTKILGQVVECLDRIRIQGKCDFVRGIQTAQIALKHRQNKTQRQRIVCFVASPIEATEKQLELLGRTLKKNNVALDLVSFGEIVLNQQKLNKLLEAVNSNDNSHLLEVEACGRILSDVILSSPIVMASGLQSPSNTVAEMGGPAAPAGDNPFGVDPATDPELYMALRMSLEEEEARQSRQAAAGGNASAPQNDEAGLTTPAPRAAPSHTPQAPRGDNSSPGLDVEFTSVDQINAMTGLDDETKQALILSLQEDNNAPAASAPKEEVLNDSEFVSTILASLPGVNLDTVQDGLKEDEKDKKEEDKKDDQKKE
eukprot:Platyproteum_vivax@DN4866_c0_g1_i1.p1